MKNFFILLLIGLVSLGLAQSANEFLTAGNAYFQKGDYTNALIQYQKALKKDPSFAPAMFKIALTYVRQGDMDKTREFINHAIEAEPDNKEYRAEFDKINEINTLMNDGNRAMRNALFDDAFTSYKLVLDKFPYFAEAAYSMGLARMRQDNYDDAIKYFNKTLELNPQHENSMAAIANVAKMTFNDGNQCYKRHDLDCAVEKYNKVVLIDPSFYQAYYQLGVIEARQGSNTLAIKHYKQALAINSDFYKGWFALGLIQRKDGRPDDALASLKKATDINPGYSKAYGAMGDIYIDQKKYNEALGVLRTAVQVDPSYDKGYLTMGMVYIEQGLFKKAIENLEIAVSLDDKDPNSWYLLARSYNEAKNCEKAKSAALRSTDLKKTYGGAWYEFALAEWCDGKGNKTAALNYLEKARNDRDWRKSAEYLMDKIKNPQKYQD